MTGMSVGSSGRSSASRRVGAGRGFSLVELLVVIAIIALIISIILPALGAVRQSARTVATQTVSKNISDAAGAFGRDNDRMPGYYSVEEMGSQENGATFGMSAMENALLDLMGGVVIVGGPGGVAASPTQVDFGPTAAARSANNTANRKFDTQRFNTPGQDTPNYLTLDPKYLSNQIIGQQVGLDGHASPDEGDPSIPDVIDAFGAPMLVWVQNSNALTPIDDIDDFVAMDSGTNGSVVARYYWASNAAFLRSTELGTERRNQVSAGGGDRDYSLLGEPTNVTPASVMNSLMALVGSPAYPDEDAIGATTPNPTGPDFVPTQGRGTFLVQSAGPDGYYFGARDRGARRMGSDPRYAWNFFTPGSQNRYINDQGQPTTEDLLPFFDDVTTQTGL